MSGLIAKIFFGFTVFVNGSYKDIPITPQQCLGPEETYIYAARAGDYPSYGAPKIHLSPGIYCVSW